MTKSNKISENPQEQPEEMLISDRVASGPRTAIRHELTNFKDEIEFDPAQDVSNEFLIKLMEEKMAMALHYIDQGTMQDASLTSIIKVFGILLDRRQLLKGQPTQIVSSGDRRALSELLPALLREAERRGLALPIIEGEMEVIDG